MIFPSPSQSKYIILALGAESAGNFSVCQNGKIFLSNDFGDLLEDENFDKYKGSLYKYLRENNLKPDVILTDLHPLYKTTLLGEELADKFGAKHDKIQHHLAHIFTVIGENIPKKTKDLYGVALDGTGYGFDGNIWGGEVFNIKTISNKQLTINRIGHLEYQTMIGGDLAVSEPARMLISILNKFLPKKEVYKYVKKYYREVEFEVLYNQLKLDFNCQQTSSTGRILDAVSVLLGFAKNERNYKHEATLRLVKDAYRGSLPLGCDPNKLKPLIQKQNNVFILNTTHLFKYLIKNINKDKKELAFTSQLYIAEGLYSIIQTNCPVIPAAACPARTGIQTPSPIFISGGISKNKIISSYFQEKGAYLNKKIPCGDAGISFGQIVLFLQRQ